MVNRSLIELSNGTPTNIVGFQAEDADLTITIDHGELEQAMVGLRHSKHAL